jgi:2-C-methyl-D-erythritol 4-phosphate cytidylyltransferase
MRAGAVIVAGGTGKRMNAGIPKQLLELSGRAIIEWTLDQFVRCPAVTEIVVVSETGILDRIREIASRLAGKPITVVPGGTERQDSVRNGVAAVGTDCGIIAVHDAVRPFVTIEEITRCIEAATADGAAVLMRPVRETVKTVHGGFVASTIDRDTVWIAQTPQAFRRDILEEAHRRAAAEGFTGPDDAVLVERLGYPVRAVPGSDLNIKITTAADFAVAGFLLDLFRKGEHHAGDRPRV